MNKRKKRATIGIAVALVAFLTWVVVAPYLTLYQMKRAAQHYDSAALSSHVDFQSVRASLKEQLDAMFAQRAKQDPRLQDSPLAALGNAAAGIAAQRLVEVYVTPEGIARLMDGARPALDSTRSATQATPGEPTAPGAQAASITPEAQAGQDTQLAQGVQAAPDGQGAAVATNTGPTTPSPDFSMAYESFNRFVVRVNDKDLGQVGLVLQRRGLGWKLTDIELPQRLHATAPPGSTN